MFWVIALTVAGLAMSVSFLFQGSIMMLLAMFVPFPMFFIITQVRCPKCRPLFGDRFPTGFSGMPMPMRMEWPKVHCEKCGRNNLWVWPFQYLIRPET